MARHDNRRHEMTQAHGRYSASDQGDQRRSAERRDHGVYGYGAEEGPGYRREDRQEGGRYGIGNGGEREAHHYYDPDRFYRADRYNSGYGGSAYGHREYSRHYGERPHDDEPYPDSYEDRNSAAYRSADDAGHRGRGPKGYQRSDDRIREDVCDYLTDDPHVDASDIEVAVKNGEVTLSGTVQRREAKRFAEEVTERASGVRHVQNNLRVGPRAETADPTPLFSRAGTDKG